MLRIESYVTPIILSYVDKYVKNIKAEDSQVSLWSGEAVFNNLDLRLDVLEQELKLPFSFVNGHIQELRIQVPWTKLISEPIVITINTIECILKLKSYGGSDSDATSTRTDDSETKKVSDRREKQKRQNLEVPTSYVQSLINKVINNVTIVCNNVILKYVEDDIVLSINAKTLQFCSVNQEWIPAFVDLSIDDLYLRNLISLTELTVCLDKRNASGKIENYQEPLLYRCSLSCRQIRQFESVYSQQPIKTRVDIFCPELHFSISDTQLPMFYRLLELLVALYYKDLRYHDNSVNQHQNFGECHKIEEQEDENSWSSWAWYVGSSLMPITWEDDDESTRPFFQRRYHTFQIGVYVRAAAWVFKLTESASKKERDGSIYGPTKMVFRPFLKIEQQGLYMTTVIKGIEAVNCQMGISALTVEPIGLCVCGVNDSKENFDKCVSDCHKNEALPKFSFVKSGQEREDYLSRSLFDQRVSVSHMEIGQSSYEWEEHMNSVTDGYLISRSGVFGLDYLYVLNIPNDVESEKLSEISENPEKCLLNDRAMCRMVVGLLEVNFSSGFAHRLYALQYSMLNYDYPPYPSENSDAKVVIPESENETEWHDYDVRTNVRTYIITFHALKINLLMSQHPLVDIAQVLSNKMKKKCPKISEESNAQYLTPVPMISLILNRVELTHSKPMYPNRIVQIALNCTSPNDDILKHVYCHYKLQLQNCCVYMYGDKISWLVELVENFSLNLFLKRLIKPELWKTSNKTNNEALLQLDKLTFHCTMPQLILLLHIVQSWFCDDLLSAQFQNHSLIEDALIPTNLGANFLAEDTTVNHASKLHFFKQYVGTNILGNDPYGSCCLGNSYSYCDTKNLSVWWCFFTFAMYGYDAFIYVFNVFKICVRIEHKYNLMAITFLKIRLKLSETLFLHFGEANVGLLNISLRKSHREILSTVLNGPETNATLDSPAENSLSSECLCQAVFQIPKRNHSQNDPSIFALKVMKMSMILGPQVLDWLKYEPNFKPLVKGITKSVYGASVNASTTKFSSKLLMTSSDKDFDTFQNSSSVFSDLKKSNRFPSWGKWTTVSSTKINKTENKWKNLVTEFYPYINNLLIRVEIEPFTLFLTSYSLPLISSGDMVNAVHRMYLTRGEKCCLGDTSVIIFPCFLMQNCAHLETVLEKSRKKPLAFPFISSSDYCGKDSSSISLTLNNFHAFSLQGVGDSVKYPLLKPVNTTATLALTPKYSGTSLSHLGVVVHWDVSPLYVNLCKRQVDAHVVVLERFVSIYLFLVALQKKLNPRVAAELRTVKKDIPQVDSQTTIKESKFRVQNVHKSDVASKGDEKNSSTAKVHWKSVSDITNRTITEEENTKGKITIPTMQESDQPNSVLVTVWLQWTIERMSANLFVTAEKERTAESGIEVMKDESSKSLNESAKNTREAKRKFEDESNINLNESAENIREMKTRNKKLKDENKKESNKILGEGFESTREIKTESRKLTILVEDLTSSVDLHQVYSKVKCKIANLSVLHFVKKGSEWIKGNHEGIIMTSYDRISRDVKILSSAYPQNFDDAKLPTDPGQDCGPQIGPVETQNEISDSKSHHGFLSLTLTSAQCKNVHNKWNQLVKKNLREEKLIATDSQSVINYLSEIDVRILPFDCILSPKTLQLFFMVCEPWFNFAKSHTPNTISSSGSSSLPVGSSFNNKVLPLLYIQSEPIRVFLPGFESEIEGEGYDSENVGKTPRKIAKTYCLRSPLVNDDNSEDKIEKMSNDTIDEGVLQPSNSKNNFEQEQDMILIQLDSIIITPQVENPLERVILRKDIYSTAEQAKILGIPGSDVEDRQYQIDFQGFCVSSGTWSDLAKVNSCRPRSTSSELLGIRGENPALEWNNFDPDAQSVRDCLVLYPIIESLDTRIIFAPAIVYERQTESNSLTSKENSETKILVAGHSLEVNFLTSVNVFAGLSQIDLSLQLAVEIARLLTSINATSNTHSNQHSPNHDILLDSGIDCDLASLDYSKINRTDSFRGFRIPELVPFEILVTGSRIGIVLYRKMVSSGEKSKSLPENSSKSKTTVPHRYRYRDRISKAAETESTDSESTSPRKENVRPSQKLKNKKLDTGYEGSSEENQLDDLKSPQSDPHLRVSPILMLNFYQPHAFVSCQNYNQKMEIQFFDLAVKSVPVNYSFRVVETKKFASFDDFTSNWFETRAGDPHPRSGVPPALFTFSMRDFLHQPAQVSLDIGRPLKVCLCDSKFKQISNVLSILNQFYHNHLFSYFNDYNLLFHDKTWRSKSESTSKIKKNADFSPISSPSPTKKPKPKMSPIKNSVFNSKNLNLEDKDLKFWDILRLNVIYFSKLSFCTDQVQIFIECSGKSFDRSEVYASVSEIKAEIGVLRKKIGDTRGRFSDRTFSGSGKLREIREHDRGSLFDSIFIWEVPGTREAYVNEIRLKGACRDFQIDTSFKSIDIQPFIRPLSILGEVDIIWQKDCVEPYLNIKLDSEIIHMNFGPEILFSLNDVKTYLEKKLFIGESNFQSTKNEAEKGVVKSTTEVVYQDDLRSGAFQYIVDQSEKEQSPELESSEEKSNENLNKFKEEIIPEPYQVIFNQSEGTMVWCYPEPRALVNIDIFPIPFISATDSLPDKTEVLCALQYFDSLQNTFINYQYFQLSESKIHHLELPTVHEKKYLAVSNVWRVCIDYRVYENDTESACNRVAPEALVASMQVNSLYSVDLIPKTRLILSLNRLNINLFNHLNLTGSKVPDFLSQYRLEQHTPKKHSFLNLSFNDTNFKFNVWQNSCNLDLNSTISVSCLDYKFLTLLSLLDHSNIKGGISVQNSEGKNKPKTFDSFLSSKEMNFRLSQATVHAFNVSLDCWKQAYFIYENLHDKSLKSLKSNLPCILPTNYIFINNTNQIIRYGQVKTDENLLLSSNSINFYSWRTHKKPAVLQICIEGNDWKWSESLCIENVGRQACTFSDENHSTNVIITVSKEKGNKILVKFEGTLTIGNRLSNGLEVKVLEDLKSSKSFQNHHTTNLESLNITRSLVIDSYVRNIKIKDVSSSIWSGKIPISPETTKDTMTVQIPLKNKEFVSVLCEVFREKVASVWRYLIIFSSHFQLKSFLPRSMALFVHTPSSNITEQTSVQGQGKSVGLNCDATLTHHLTFQVNPELEASKPPIPINKSLVSQIKQNQPAERINIDDIIASNFSNSEEKWPYIDSFDFDGKLLYADQPKVDLQISFLTPHSNCNSLIVDVKPWNLIINHTGVEILIQHLDGERNTWYIPYGAVFAPPKLDDLFSFGVFEDGEEYFCGPLQLYKDERWYSLNFEGKLPKIGSTNVCINMQKKVAFVTVLSSYKENIQILYLVPTFTISNNVKEHFSVNLKALSNNKNDENRTKLENEIIEIHPLEDEAYEIPLIYFAIEDKSPNSDSFDYTVSFSLGQNDFYSSLVLLNDFEKDVRANVFLPNDFKSDASKSRMNKSYIITTHPLDSRLKIVIQKDLYPQSVIYNNTPFDMYVRSCQNKGNKNKLSPTPPLISSHKCISYSCPVLSSNFPEVANGKASTKLQLSVGFFEIDDRNWSFEFDVNEIHDQFVSIPHCGDVKIKIERIGPTFHVYVDPASRVEISAKDVRKRIENVKSEVGKSSRVLSTLYEEKTIEFQDDNLRTSDKSNFEVEIGGENSNLTKTGVDLENEISSSRVRDNGKPNDVKDNILNSVEKNLSNVVHLPTNTCKTGEKETECNELKVFYFSFNCLECSVTFEDSMKNTEVIKEVVRITFDDLSVNVRPILNLSEKVRTLDYSVRDRVELVTIVGEIQVDNQLSEGNFDYPVILLSQQSNLEKKINKKFTPDFHKKFYSSHDAVLVLSIIIENSVSPCTVDSVNLRLKPLIFNIEDVFLYHIFHFYSLFDLGNSRLLSTIESPKKKVMRLKLPKDFLVKSNALANALFINELKVSSISLLLSVHASIKIFLAINNSPLNFNEYCRRQILTTWYALGHNMTVHYLSSALLKAGWVVSSLDLLGNPGGFARAVGSGLRDFVQLPYDGILNGPWAFVAGMTNGSMSLLKHLTAGSLVSVTNLANSVARNMERLSLDEDHLNRNESFRKEKPDGVTYGIAKGLSSFGISLLGAVGGLARQPIAAILEKGVTPSSIVGGVGKGLVGVVTKPIGGAADLIGYAGQGLLHGTGWKLVVKQRKLSTCYPRNDNTNSDLKIVWKVLAGLPEECCRINCSADAMLLTLSGSLTPVTVILTPQVLFIIGVLEDAQEHVFPLHELEMKCHPQDPTLIKIYKTIAHVVNRNLENDDDSVYHSPNDHVAEYVRSVSTEANSKDLGGNIFNRFNEENVQESWNERDESKTPCVKLYLSAQLRSHLFSCINIAVRASKGKGFLLG